MKILFSSERLTMREVKSADRNLYVDLYSDPDLMKHIAKPLEKAQLEKSFNVALKNAFTEKLHNRFLIINETDSNKAFGLLGLQWDKQRKGYELGIILKKEAHSGGYSLESCVAIIDYLFENKLATKVLAKSSKHNVKAIESLKRQGFSPESGTENNDTISWYINNEQ